MTVPAAEIDLAKPASLWLAVFARRRETPVGRGENAGTRLVEYHIVRQLDRLGPWTGKAVDMQVPMAPMDKNTGCAVILQVDGAGVVRLHQLGPLGTQLVEAGLLAPCLRVALSLPSH